MRIVFCLLLLFVVANTASAPEVYGDPRIQSKPRPLASYEVHDIAKVVSAPQTYNLRLIRFRGVVTEFRTMPRGVVRNETHVFTLTDNTGAIEIFYTSKNGSFGVFNTEMLVEGNPIDVLVTISYIPSPGSEGKALAANLRWVEQSQD
jgi:hypothetical protein